MVRSQKSIVIGAALSALLGTHPGGALARDPIPPAPLDHFVYAVQNLEGEAEEIERRLGVKPIFGGEHPALGTANMLFSIGDGIYFELFGEAPGGQIGEFYAPLFASLTRPDILTFAVRTNNIEVARQRAVEAGFEASPISVSSRRTPSGELLEWRGVILQSAAYKGLIPFFIEWGENTPHPATTAPSGVSLAAFRVMHPEPEPLREMYQSLGIDIDVQYGNRPAILIEIQSESGAATIIGSGRGLFD